MMRFREELAEENPRLKKEWIRVINNKDEAVRKYVLETQGFVYEADNEQDIMARIIKDYIETDDRNMQLLFRMDFARALAMYSIMINKNVDIQNNGKEIKENYAAEEDDPDYEKDYDEPDVILDVQDEFTLFKGINELEYAKVYYRDKNGKYKLF
ncbi:hypothetical protein [Clostridium baratii]|uniref:hypothetical protein n=1 Tax=Clostridium baratii TaxID=1561 RepID=UPI0030CB53EA